MLRMATVANSPVRRDMESVTRPDPHKHATEILCWILFWPWNLVWSICVNNPFPLMGRFVVRLIKSTFEEISSGEFKKIEAELAIEPARLALPLEERQVYIAPATNQLPPLPSKTLYVASAIAPDPEVATAEPRTTAPPMTAPSTPMWRMPLARPSESNSDSRIAGPLEVARSSGSRDQPLMSSAAANSTADDNEVAAAKLVASALSQTPPVPDPTLYIKQDVSEPGTYSAPRMPSATVASDPWYVRAELGRPAEKTT